MLILEQFMNPPDSPYTQYRGIGFTPDEFIKSQVLYVLLRMRNNAKWTGFSCFPVT